MYTTKYVFFCLFWLEHFIEYLFIQYRFMLPIQTVSFVVAKMTGLCTVSSSSISVTLAQTSVIAVFVVAHDVHQALLKLNILVLIPIVRHIYNWFYNTRRIEPCQYMCSDDHQQSNE
jgi:hypothetical protein